MQPKSEYPVNTWRLSHQELRGSDVWRRVERLDRVRNSVRNAYNIGQTWSAHTADRSQPVPDLVAYVGYYGYARLLVQGWTELPIKFPASLAAACREWGIGTTFQEFYELQIPGAAGGFMKRAVKEPRFTTDTLQKQLHEKSTKMVELANKPVEWFTPEAFTEDEIAEDEDSADRARLDELFDLFDQLTCFLYAMPKFTSFAITEEEERFGLPSRELYDALDEIDLNRLYGQLAETEDKLKPILRFLARQKYEVRQDSAPEGFWWRHWKPENRPRQQRNQPHRKK